MTNTSEAPAVGETIRHLAARWARADKRILKHVFPLLIKGKPVSVQDIAEAARCDPAVADTALNHGKAERDSQGRIVELSGLMLPPTLHRIEIDGVALFGCCALMVHQVPLLIGRPIEVESIDPVSRRIIQLSIDPGGVRGISTRRAAASFVVTDATSVKKNVCQSFCCHVKHFASPDSARQFAQADSHRYTISIQALHQAARMLYSAVWAEATAPDAP